jgi:hypothetical protein
VSAPNPRVAAQQLGQQVRLALRPAECLPQLLIGLAPENVTGDLRDGGLIEGT